MTSCLMMLAMTLPFPLFDSPKMAKWADRGNRDVFARVDYLFAENIAITGHRRFSAEWIFHRIFSNLVKVTTCFEMRKNLCGVVLTSKCEESFPSRGATCSAHA